MQFPKDYYVYLLYEPETAKPFYCGKGKGSRAWQHLVLSQNGKYKDACHKKIKSLLEQGIEYEVVVVQEELSESEALILEVETIKFYGRRDQGGSLLNHTDGGEGVSGFKFSEESRRKLSEKRKIQMLGKQNGKGAIRSTRRPVIGLIFGTIVERFDCILNVQKGGYSSSSVAACLSGKRKFHRGIEWRYAEEQES